MEVFSIDNKTFPTIKVTSLKRSFQIVDGENAGRSNRGTMIRDVIGTYYNYTIELLCLNKSQKEYTELYEILSKPVDSHTIKVPYNQETIEFKAYITSGDDELKHMSENGNIWHGLTVNFIAMKPYRRPE